MYRSAVQNPVTYGKASRAEALRFEGTREEKALLTAGKTYDEVISAAHCAEMKLFALNL